MEKTFSLPVGRVVVGRAQDCYLRLHSQTVSRKHCVLTTSRQGATVEDLESRLGTQVNDVRILGPRALCHGDVLRIGSYSLEYQDDSFPVEMRPATTPAEYEFEPLVGGAADGDVWNGEVAKWLEEADEQHREQLRFDRCNSLLQPSQAEVPDELVPRIRKFAKAEPEHWWQARLGAKKTEQSKPKYGRLPPRPRETFTDSGAAAHAALRKMFGR